MPLIERTVRSTFSKSETEWTTHLFHALRVTGYAVVENVLSADLISESRDRMYKVQEKIHAQLGRERLEKAGERGVLRLMMKHDAFFLRYLELPEVLNVVDQTLSPTAILHLQNGFILPSFSKNETPDLFQNNFH